MHRIVGLALLLLYVTVTPPASFAADFDGSKPFLCSVIEVNECVPGEGCKSVSAEDINLPRHLWINVGGKTIQSKPPGEAPRISAIEAVKQVDGKLILQGAEQGRDDVQDGFGWTIAILQDTGQMVLTASGDLVAEIVFGVCTLY